MALYSATLCYCASSGELVQYAAIAECSASSLVHLPFAQTDKEENIPLIPAYLTPTTTRFLGLTPYSNPASTHASFTKPFSTPSMRYTHRSTTIRLSTTPAQKAIKLQRMLRSFFLRANPSSYWVTSSALTCSRCVQPSLPIAPRTYSPKEE